MALSKYDEFPVHQASRPFSHIPSTDYSWDDGYYFGVFNADKQIFLLTGMRVNPNADMVGGYAIIEARDLDAAAEIAKGCPTYEVNGLVEVRPVRQM